MSGKRFRILCGGLILASLLLAVCWWLRPPPEPMYQGKPLSYWLGAYSVNAAGEAMNKIAPGSFAGQVNIPYK